MYDIRKPKEPIFINKESESVVISCDFTNDQKHILSTTYDGILNITSLATQKFVVKYDNFGHPKTIDSKALHCCRSIKNHKKVGNTFLVGGENSMTSVVHFDANAKYEAWLLEG